MNERVTNVEAATLNHSRKIDEHDARLKAIEDRPAPVMPDFPAEHFTADEVAHIRTVLGQWFGAEKSASAPPAEKA